MLRINRRQLLGSSAVVLVSLRASIVYGAVIKGGLPWVPGSADPPEAVTRDGWKFFTAQEAAAVEAFVDRLIPADALSPSGTQCGCAVYIDRQLAGPQGSFSGYYMSGPFQNGTKQQGPQSPVTPAQSYRTGVAAVDGYCRAHFGNKSFAQLTDQQKDQVISGLDGSIKLDGASGQDFFKLILKDTQNGFLADPIYGGNRDMASWKMIGFPGAHYDYRDWIDRHNERVTLAPVGINNHPNWSQ